MLLAIKVHAALVLAATALQISFLALGEATIPLWCLISVAVVLSWSVVAAVAVDEERWVRGQLAVAVVNAAVLAAALWQGKEFGQVAYGVVLTGSALVLLACPVAVTLGVVEASFTESALRNSVLKEYLADMRTSTALRAILFPLLISGSAIFLRTRFIDNPVALVATVLTGLTGLLLLAPSGMLVLGVHYQLRDKMHRWFCYVYSITEWLETFATCTAVTLIWLTHPDYNEKSKSDLAAMGLLLSFGVVYILISCGIYAFLLQDSGFRLMQYGSKAFQLYMPSLRADTLWSDVQSSPTLTVLLQPVLFFLVAAIPTTIVLGQSIEAPDECRTGRHILFVDFAAGTVAVGLLCMGTAVETMRWKRGMIVMTAVSTLFALGYLGFKCFVLWAYGYMSCEGRFHVDIRNVVLSNEYLYFACFFLYSILLCSSFGDTGAGDWWEKFGVNVVYFRNDTVCTAVKKLTDLSGLWGIFHALVVTWEVVAMAKCGADGIARETWPYLQIDHTPGGGCKDTPWYPMSVMFSVATTVLLTWCTISVRLHRPAILFNTGRAFHYYFWSDLVLHVMILGNLALAIGTLVEEPTNRGWGITFTVTNTFRLVMVICAALAEFAAFQERHQALADALIEHFTLTSDDPNRNHGAAGVMTTLASDAATNIYEPTDMFLDEFMHFTNIQEHGRTSEELRLEELRQRVLHKAKRGGLWLRRLRGDGSVAWVAAEDLNGTQTPASASASASVTATADASNGANEQTNDNHKPRASSGSDSISGSGSISEHKSSVDSVPGVLPVVSLGKTSSYTAEHETNQLLGTYFCVVQPDGSVVWRPGDMLHTVTNIADGLPRDFGSAQLAAVATLAFEDKCAWVRSRLDDMRIPWERGHQDLYVERTDLLNGSVAAMNSVSSARMRQIFRFHFRGEQGLDAGGVAREWFECVAREVFDPKLGLFKFASTDNVTYQIDSRAVELLGEERCKELYFFTGRLVGKAMFDNHLMSAHLVRPLYKHLLGIPVGFQDLQFVDDHLYDSMCWMLAEDNVEQLELAFTAVEIGADGLPHEMELEPGGADKVVTDENKLDYIRAAVKYRMFTRQEFAIGHILRGFFDVIPQGLLSVFDAQELELVLCGFDDIDLQDWKANTLYEGVFSSNHKVVQWFWDILGKLSTQQRTRLLQYVTGTSRVPIGGFKQLQGVDGQVRRFTIRSLQLNEHEYPRSHTCFNRLDLPVYSSKAHLESVVSHLTTMEIEGFSMD